ncbi:MAG TPA: hypothetical protein VGA52_13220 [Anaerolineales bacterium]|jgi:hypothetical protein
MLPYVVIILGGLYLLLHFSGIFEDIANFFNRPHQDGEPSSRRARLDGEIERRLKVFEDFLSSDEEDDEPG